jgi:nitrite reductase/ring-hydroxylating ferredoxin subunit
VAPWSALGVELVLWADAAGSIRAADAHCPHMGAHLGHGGRTDATGSLTCPFHGWCFEPDRGRRVGADGPQAAGVDLHPTAEVAGHWYVFLDHEEDRASAPWPLVDLRRPDDAAPDHLEDLEVELPAHQQLVIEGEFDAGHFPLLHDRRFDLVASSFEGSRASARYAVTEPMAQEVELELDGVSRMRLEVRWAGHRFVVIGDYVTRAPDRVTASGTIALWGDEPRSLARVVRRVRRTQEEDLARDAAIWAHRAYEAPFRPGPEDGLLVAFRRWALQFYG